ncbi:ArnT family glycosyltransferase [Candidatus Alkanophaga liquidiphilum]
MRLQMNEVSSAMSVRCRNEEHEVRDVKREDVLIASTLFLIGFLIRGVGVSKVNMYVDEWLYWADMNKILVSGFVPRADVFDYSPPTVSYIAATVTVLFNGDLSTIRMISVIFGSLSIPFMYFLGKAMYDRQVGLLSGIFLCFSAYHCLYSRVFMLDVPMLFFIIAFLYFFWLSQRPDDTKSGIYACVAGAMLGLALDVKYLALFLLPTIFAYVLWVNRFRLGVLRDRRILLMLLFTFLFFLPLLVCLIYTGVGFHGFKFYAVEKFETKRIGQRPCEFPLDELLYRSWKRGLEVFAWGSDVLPPPLPSVFVVSTTLLILIALFYHLPAFMRGEKESSFFVILIAVLSFAITVSGNMSHYLLSLLPPFYVMFSHIIVERKKELRVIVVPLAVVVLSLSMVTTVTSYYWDTGDYHPWVKDALEHIKRDAVADGIVDEQVTIGVMHYLTEFVDYQLSLSDFNATAVYLFKPASEYSGEVASVNLKKLNQLKPDYIIMDEVFYKHYFSDVKREVLKDYRVILCSYAYPQHYIILKRKATVEELEGIKKEDEGVGKEVTLMGKRARISEDIFKRSVPAVMKVGHAYTVLVHVKNLGDATNFIVVLHFDKFTMFVNQSFVSLIYIPKEWRFSIDENSTYTLKLEVVPFRKYEGKLPMTVELYAECEDGTYKKVDSCTDYVYLIRG